MDEAIANPLKDAWAFLDKELENFQKIVAEFEAGKLSWIGIKILCLSLLTF